MSKADLASILIIPDVHIPYHNQRAWDLMLKVASTFKPSTIIVLGDFGDFYAVSDFSKDPTRATKLELEVLECNLHLDELDALHAKQKVFIAGNHENRLERYLKTKAPELFSMVNVEGLFGLKRRGWQYVPYRSDIRLGAVYFTHDVGQTGRTAAHRALDTYQHSVVTGHTHRLVSIVEGNATGEAMLSAQFGWLGDVKQVDYMHRIKAAKDWALGFGWGYARSNGYMYVSPIPIIPKAIEYSCVVDGRLFRG